MNKEEILRKSRNENNDEGIEFTENKGRKLGFIAFICVYVFILVFNAEMGRSSYELYALCLIFLSSEAVPKYKFTRKKRYLIISILGMIATILTLGKYIILLVSR